MYPILFEFGPFVISSFGVMMVSAFLICNYLMKKDIELDGFDSRFFLFLEDTDLCRRCWEKGKKVRFYPEVTARDGKQRLSGSGFLHMFTKKTGRIHIVSAVKYFMKWGLQ